MKIERIDNEEVIFDGEKSDLRGKNLRGADLCGADLRGADLRGADLRGADLCGTDLRKADLRVAYLCGADLCGANLCGADLRGADLYGADLRSADLRSADLRSADLRGADLENAKINWNSHDLISKILADKAGTDIERRKIAGLIIVSRDWCWSRWILLRDEPQFDWAISALAAYVQDDDGVPEILRDRAAKLRTEETPQVPS